MQACNPRAASTGEIATAARRTGTEAWEAESMQAALERARNATGRQGVVVITGSIYLVGEALGILAPSTLARSD